MISDPHSPHPEGRYKRPVCGPDPEFDSAALRTFRVEIRAIAVIATTSPTVAVETVRKLTLTNSGLCFESQSVEVKP